MTENENKLINMIAKLISDIEWWQSEHGCCHGYSDDTLKDAHDLVGEFK